MENYSGRSAQDIERLTREVFNQHALSVRKSERAALQQGIRDGIARLNAYGGNSSYQAGYKLGKAN